jgi:nicotinamidase-related amidase
LRKAAQFSARAFHTRKPAMIELDPKSTALVLIDLQKGILGNTLTPTTAQELLARGQALAERFRAAKATVVLVQYRS